LKGIAAVRQLQAISSQYSHIYPNMEVEAREDPVRVTSEHTVREFGGKQSDPLATWLRKKLKQRLLAVESRSRKLWTKGV
jgi:hypothetical protein